MEFLRVLQRQPLRQFLSAQPLRRSFHPRQIRQATQPTFRTRPFQSLQSRLIHSGHRPNVVRKPYNLRFRTTRRYQSTDATPEAQMTLNQRMRKLSREYGWSALGVYLLLTAADFPFCFLAVRLLGPDRIGHWEHVVLGYIKAVVKWPFGGDAQAEIEEAKQGSEGSVSIEQDTKRVLDEASPYEVQDHGYKEAIKANKGADASKYNNLPSEW